MECFFRLDKFRTNLSRNYTNVYIIPLNTGACPSSKNFELANIQQCKNLSNQSNSNVISDHRINRSSRLTNNRRMGLIIKVAE